jgi:phospholipase/carboxylesterase
LLTLPFETRPARGEPEGALVLLHGRGADQFDLFPLLDAFDPERRLHGVTPGAPLTNVPPGGRHWYLVERVGYPDRDTFHAAYAELETFLDQLLEEREIPWERTLIGGFSMGAVMSYAIALGEGRPAPAGVLAMSGFVPTVDGWEPHFGGRWRLPVLVHHGRLDPIIPVDFGRRAARLLREGDLDVTYLESNAAHGVPPELVPQATGFVARCVAG